MDISVLVTNADLAPPARALLEQRQARITYVPISTSAAELTALMTRQRFDGVISRTVEITAAAIAGAPDLRVISKYGVGFDNIDVEAATRAGIPVAIARGANAQSVAEHAFGLLLAVVKRLVPLDASMRGGKWIKSGQMAREISGLHLGLIGCGNVGRAVARIAQGFGMNVSAYDPYLPSASVPSGVRLVQKLDDLLAQADVVSPHCPLTNETRGMIGRAQFAAMKPGALLLNTARGPVVDEAALVDALASDRIAGAGLDVFADEPPAPNNPLFEFENVVLTPHVAGSTVEAVDRVAVLAVENLLAVLDGKSLDPGCVVNSAALERVKGIEPSS